MRTTRSCRRSERGTQLAELAVVLPLLCFLVFTILEGSAFIRVHQVINNAAREGARLSATETSQPSADTDPVPGIRRAVAGYACNNGLDLNGSGITCTTASFTCGSTAINVVQNANLGATDDGISIIGSKVSVTCTYHLTYLPALPFFGVAADIPLAGSASFRNIWN